jgi:hypothetical protein
MVSMLEGVVKRGTGRFINNLGLAGGWQNRHNE